MIDGFHSLADRLTAKFMKPARLYRVNGGNDRLTGRRSNDEHYVECLAILAPVRTTTANGVIVHHTVATLTVKPKAGDRISMNGVQYTFETVEEIAPDGRPIIWRGVVK